MSNKSTNAMRRTAREWPHNERMFFTAQEAWMQEFKNADGTVGYKPMYSKGVNYVKPKEPA